MIFSDLIIRFYIKNKVFQQVNFIQVSVAAKYINLIYHKRGGKILKTHELLKPPEKADSQEWILR